MTRTDAPLRVRSIEDLLAVVPSLLGFHPRESLVLICIESGRVALTARTDLAAMADREGMVEALEPVRRRFPSGDLVAVGYSTDVANAWRALDDLADLLGEQQLDRAVVAGDRWHATPDDEGQRFDVQTNALAAEAAFRGIRVLPDREALAASLDPVGDVAAMDAALNAALDREPSEVVEEGVRLAERGAPPDGAEAAVLALSAFSPAFLESVIMGIDDQTVEAKRALWLRVVRCVSPCAAPGALLIVAMTAWVAGDGALANLCLSRAAPGASESPWFRFLEMALRIALPPSEWAGVRRDLVAGLAA